VPVVLDEHERSQEVLLALFTPAVVTAVRPVQSERVHEIGDERADVGGRPFVLALVVIDQVEARPEELAEGVHVTADRSPRAMRPHFRAGYVSLSPHHAK